MDPHHSTEEEFPEHISMSSAGTKESDVASRSANGVGMEDFEDNPASPMSRNSKAASKLIRTRRDKGRSTHASVHSASSADPDDRSATSIDTRDTTPPSANNPRIGAAPRLPPSPMSDVSRDYLIMPEASEKEADQSHLASGTVGSASPTALRCLRRIRANRKRVPGGAAAKLIGRSVDGGKYEGDSHMEHYEDDEDVEIEPPTDELHEIRRKAKEEFARGSTSNRRYHEPERYSTEDNGKAMSEASLPSILNRSEAFHESATAAVISLLAPKQAHDLGSVVSPKSCLEDAPAFVNIPPVSAFQPPIRGNRDDASVITPAAGNGDGEDRYEHAISSARSPLAQPLLSRKAEERVEEMARQMKDPSKTLSDLLSAIASPDNGDLNRGYMVRRKNACGALQVLTAKNVHRVQICWTIGVLPVLTSVLEDAGDNGPDETFPDISTRREYLEARKRAIASLMNLSMPTDNRLAVFHSPRLIASVVDVIKEDEGESRRGCCAVLGYLAKTSENRLLMVQVPGLLSVITDVIKPKKSPEQENPEPAGKMYNYDSSASEEDDAIDTISSTDASVASPEEEKKQEKADAKRDPSTVEDSGKAFAPYDEDPNQYLHGARQNVFALLGHLLKEKDNAVSIIFSSIIGLDPNLLKNVAHIISSFYSIILRDTRSSQIHSCTSHSCTKVPPMFWRSSCLLILLGIVPTRRTSFSN
jgi:hypothetical protein